MYNKWNNCDVTEKSCIFFLFFFLCLKFLCISLLVLSLTLFPLFLLMYIASLLIIIIFHFISSYVCCNYKSYSSVFMMLDISSYYVRMCVCVCVCLYGLYFLL